MDKIETPQLFAPSGLSDMLKEKSAKGFNIPIYQRQYAWTHVEITKMLEDFYNAYKAKTNEYFVGNLVLHYNPHSLNFDIIDGQQRTTTLWLIGLILRIKDRSWNNYLSFEGNITLRFTTRNNDNDYLEKLFSISEYKDIETIEGIVNGAMINAIRCIKAFVLDKDAGFSEYIFNKVKMAAVYLPDAIDLNKYFEDMNNRGLQLEPHHIVKSKFLEKVSDNLKESYGSVWDAVSQMNQYIEYGFAGTLKDNRKKIKEKLNFFNAEQNEENGGSDSSDVYALINSVLPENAKSHGDDQVFDNKVTSIINFPEFLLHCLKLHSKKEISLDDSKLLHTFDNIKIYTDAEKFISFMFEMRILFDSNIIKNSDTSEGFRWSIMEIKEDKDDKGENVEFKRAKKFGRKIIQIQSMLYASTSTAVWLNDVLSFLHHNNSPNENTYFEKLEEIDSKVHINIELSNNNLNERLNNGTGTLRYYFYKLDYLLWKKWSMDGGYPNIQGINSIKEKIENYQFRINRSVEHIHPQNPKEETWPENLENKNDFGNLALISVSSNSSYNNQNFGNKKSDFIKRTSNWGIESLKLLEVYNNEKWCYDEMEKHDKAMKEIFKKHYNISSQ